MEKRAIGTLQVSVVGLGCNNFGWRIDAQKTAEVVSAALDAGINFLDTADIYGGTESEKFLGKALSGRRDQVVLATKFGMRVDDERKGARPDYVRRAVEDSLQRLQTDHIDLYQLHTPDASTPIADTLGALADLVKSGKVREIGCSNFSTTQLKEAADAVHPGAPRFVSVQNEYSLLHRNPEQGVLAEAHREGMAFLPFFPLASGLLTGKYAAGKEAPEGARLSGSSSTRFLNDSNQEVVAELKKYAESRGHTLLELAFSWLLDHREVASVIAGATRPDQVHANVGAAGWKLSAEERAAIDQIAPQPKG
jgi:aryl-alcohol dehydrogenase-like predicted oxidoreductase